MKKKYANVLDLPIKDSMRIASGTFNYVKWNPLMMRQQISGKPTGMWYSLGKSWLEWCNAEDFGDKPKYIDLLELDESRVLKITNAKELKSFEKRYSIVSPHVVRYNEYIRARIAAGDKDVPELMSVTDKHSWTIDFVKVKEEYGAIEIAPYQWEFRLSRSWYYPWDCASGSVWDEKTLISRKRLYVLKNGFYVKAN